MSNGGSYVYALGLDTAAMEHGVNKAKQMFNGLGKSATQAGEEADAAMQKLKSSIASVAAGVSLGMLAKKVAEVRGEVQQLEVAFETMLGSKAKADALMEQMINLAAKTPFGLQDVTNAAKQLLAFGSTAEQVADEITMIGDIASGLSIPLGDLIYLYGTTRTQGGLFTQDLKQFMQRGIPLADELAKVMGITADEVRELVSQGKVGFPEVQKALQGMTAEGGQFGGLMEKQSQTITGQISALEDSIYQMFNAIGESNEGLISAVLSGAGWVVEHYQEILDILTVLVSTYGAYKAAIILTAATQKALALAKSINAFFQLAKGIKSAKEAMILLNTVTKASPIGILASVIGAVVGSIWAFGDSTEKAADATEELEREIGELEQAARDEYTEVNKLAYAYEHLATSEEERADIMSQLKDISPDLVKGMENEATAIEALTTNLAAYNDEQMREIEIATQKDRYLGAAANVRQAQSDKIAAETNLGLDLQYLYGATTEAQIEQFKKTLRFRTLNNEKKFGSDAEDKNLRKAQEALATEYANFIKETLGDASLSTVQKAEKITNWTSEQKFFTISDIPGVDMAKNIKLLKQAEKSIVDSTAIVDSLVLGEEVVGTLEEKLNESTETAVNLGETYRTAREEWLNAKAEMERINLNRDDYTTDQYKAADTRLEAAEKAFKAVGGTTTTSTKQTDAEKRAKEAAERAVKLQHDADQALVDMMAEGTDKKVAQIELDYRIRGDEIDKQEADLRAKQNGAITKGQQELFNTLRKSSANDYADAMSEALFGDTDAEGSAVIQKMDAERKAWNKYLEEYGTFQERLKATTIRYNEAIAAAETEGERKSLEAERDAALAVFEVQAQGYAKELADKSMAELVKLMKDLEAQVKAKQEAFDALDSSSGKEAQDYLKTINTLKAQIEALKKRINEAQEATDTGNWADAVEIMQNIASAASDAASSLSEVDEAAGAALQVIATLASSTTNLLSAVKSFKEATDVVGKVSSMLGAVGVAIELVASVIAKIVQSRKEFEQTIKAFETLNEELTQMRRLANVNSLKGTIFGEDAFGNFANNLNVMRDAMDAYNKAQDAVINRGKEVTNAIVGFEEYGIAVTKYKWDDIADSISNMQVLLKDRGKFAESWGFKDKYASLGDMLPDLFGDEGVTLDALKELQQSDVWDKLSQENRDLIDQMIADWEYFNEATDAVKDYLTDIFGEMGNSINDAIVEAFMNGADAAEAFGDVAGEVIENLIKQVGYSAYIAPILTKAMADVEALNGQGLSSEEYLNALMSIVGDAMGAAESQLEEYNKFLENADNYAESVGINTFDSERSAQSKGIAQASQDSVDELNGRMTAIQGHTYALMEGQRQLINDSAQVLRHLAGIESNTAELRHMSQYMAAMRSDINDIATRGIITR